VHKKTLVQALNNACDIVVSPCLKGDLVSMQIPKETYLAGLGDCKNHLHGRSYLPKETNL